MIRMLMNWIFGADDDEFDVEEYDNSAMLRRLDEIGANDEPRVFDFEDGMNAITEAEKHALWYESMIEGDFI